MLYLRFCRTQTFAPQDFIDELRSTCIAGSALLHSHFYADDFFLGLIIVYILDILVRLYGLGWRSYSANGWNLFDIVVASGSLITIIAVRFNAGGFVIQQLQKLFITCIAFKLVQRTNSLNKLFKTSVYGTDILCRG
jgi:voltage-dependent calcium channel